jgi:hypothetical protein
MCNAMETETAQEGVKNGEAAIVETLDRLILELRRLNKGSRKQRVAALRFNQQTRALLEQLRAELGGATTPGH